MRRASSVLSYLWREMLNTIVCSWCLSDEATLFLINDLEELEAVWCTHCNLMTWGDESERAHRDREALDR